MLIDRFSLAQRKCFWASEKYADGQKQMSLFNKTEAHARQESFETGKEIGISSQKWKKEEDRSSFEVTEAVEYKLSGGDRYCTDYGAKYKVISKETVKRLKFIPSIFEVAYVYSYPKMCIHGTSGKTGTSYPRNLFILEEGAVAKKKQGVNNKKF